MRPRPRDFLRLGAVPYLAALASGSCFAQQLYYGADPNGSLVQPLSRWPNASKARLQFLKNLTPTTYTLNFENVSRDATADVPIMFNSIGINQDLRGYFVGGDGGLTVVPAGTTYKGNYGTSPPNFWAITTGSSGAQNKPTNFSIEFQDIQGNPVAINAFGFNGIDIGDFDGKLGMKTTRNGQVINDLQIELVPGNASQGSVLFYGLLNSEGQAFDTVEFDTSNVTAITPGDQDIFSFDDLIAAFYSQQTPKYPTYFNASLQPYAANPQLLLGSLTNLQTALLTNAGRCDRYGWVLDDIDINNPAFRYLHGNISNDWRFCYFAEGGQDFVRLNSSGAYGAYNVDSSFFKTGLEYRLNNKFILGGVYAYASPSLSGYSDTYTTMSISNALSTGSLYLNYKIDDNWNLSLLGSVGSASSNAYRNYNYSSFLFSNAKSSWSSSISSLGVDFGYEYFFSKKKTRYSPKVRPSLGYQVSAFSSPSISESGDGELVDLNPYSVNASIGTASFAFEYPIKLDSDGISLFVPKISVDYKYDFYGNNHNLYTVKGVVKSDNSEVSTSALLYNYSELRLRLLGDLNFADSFTFYAAFSLSSYPFGFGYAYEGGLRVRI